MTPDLSILIPTLNRPRETEHNLEYIIKWASFSKRRINVEVIVSENLPNEGKALDTDTINNLTVASPVSLKIFNQTGRISANEQMKFVFEKSSAKWVMWLGDDDLVTTSYLNTIENIICDNDPAIGAIEARFCEIKSVEFFKTMPTEQYEVLDFTYRKTSPAPYRLVSALRGHQLSGNVYRRDLIDESYPHVSMDCVYPWIAFLMYISTKSKILRILSQEILVTSDIPKNFTYGGHGLIPDTVEAVVSVPGMGFVQRQLYTFMTLHSSYAIHNIKKVVAKPKDLVGFFKSVKEDGRIPLAQLLLAMPYLSYYSLIKK